MSSIDQPQPILDRLEAIRSRLTLERALAVAAWLGLLTVGVFGILTLGTHLAPRWPWLSWISAEVPWVVAGATVAVGFLGAALHVHRTRPDLSAVARQVDRQLELDERLSTALEFGLANGPEASVSPVVRALFRDAAAQAERVNPKALVPLTLPRAVWPTLAVAAAVLALETTDPFSRGGFVGPGGAAAERADTVELVREAAQELRQEAEEEQNEYLGVVATSLQTLADDIVEEGATGGAMRERLEALLAHAEAAAGPTEGGELGLDSASVLGASGDAAAAEDPLEEWGGEGPMDGEPAGEVAAAGAEASLDRSRTALEELRSQFEGGEPRARDEETRERAEEPVERRSEAERAEMDFEPSEADPPVEEAFEPDRALGNEDLAPGIPGEGGDDEFGVPQEGVGEQALTGVPEEAPLPEAASSEDFELPMEGGSLRRLPVEIVPETRISEVEETPLVRGDWGRSLEARVSSERIGLSHRAAASRYFLSLTLEPHDGDP